MRVFIVDDEMLAREELKDLLAEFDQVEVVGEFSNGVECLKALPKHRPDVLFLDIEMPMISGLELASMIDPESAPDIVFVTAYDQFAIQAFEQNAVDYLLKPVQSVRLQQCLERLSQRSQQQAPAFERLVQDRCLTLIPCHQGASARLVRLDAFEYAYSDVAGVHLWDGQGQVHTHLTLKVLEDRTPMLRCHRQYLVLPQAIREIRQEDDGNAVVLTMSGQELPVSRRYFKALRDLFSIN
ncbi:two-component system response regulator BtsR [Reinekea blandensis]|uniref:Putative response regulator n=1 Tax=Reinekea blandensis MED297 TaxID=314283 RepID=A4BFL3_9GAMM|nr:two-component system response regulator BtsR [Reinekea blandensis]EAR09108.1 putative response regulator [Reinekea sp. MED297] [Reinekea blandensis MED297]